MSFQEGVEGLLGLNLLLSHPDLMELLFDRRLPALGQLVQDVSLAVW